MPANAVFRPRTVFTSGGAFVRNLLFGCPLFGALSCHKLPRNLNELLSLIDALQQSAAESYDQSSGAADARFLDT